MATYKTKGLDDAFPATSYYDDQPVSCSDGLTKREFFAALALAGLIARGASATATAAGSAVSAADALIEALNSD